MSTPARVVHQVARPTGMPIAEQFAYVDVPMPEPDIGQALVENVLLSVDPYMRELMDESWELHAQLEGRTIGRVIETRTPQLAEGDLVFHRQGWTTHAVVQPGQVGVRRLERPDGVPLSAYLSILGGTGLTAYVALTRIARLQPGESVFVSAAAGGVGSAAGQIARMLGASRVVGSAGSDAKVAHLTDSFGFDAAFNYRSGPIAEQLAAVAPDGVDIYIDNVGGEHLEAALSALRDRGRVASVGAIAQYNGGEPPSAPRNLSLVVEKSLRIEGFLVRDYRRLQPELEALLIPHIQAGKIRCDTTVYRGFERMVDAFLGMLAGHNTGKTLVSVDEPR